MKNATKTILLNISNLIDEKGESICLKDFLKPELEYLIRIANLSYEDRKMARLYFLEGKKATDVMSEIPWYSTNTFTRHKKLVTKALIETAFKIRKRL